MWVPCARAGGTPQALCQAGYNTARPAVASTGHGPLHHSTAIASQLWRAVCATPPPSQGSSWLEILPPQPCPICTPSSAGCVCHTQSAPERPHTSLPSPNAALRAVAATGNLLGWLVCFQRYFYRGDLLYHSRLAGNRQWLHILKPQHRRLGHHKGTIQ